MQIPEHHQRTVIPHIMLDGAAEAIRFYENAFDATELFRLDGDDGRIVHAEIGIHGATLMLGDAHLAPFAPPSATVTSVALHVYVPDVDALTSQAVAAGAELLSEPADMPYGARQSMLRDPFGHLWIFLTPLAA
ncbi:VOC family protein [Streptomyces sp. SP17BM10]|uniref:VOC family protein n=1 Tax=Streptomyces sp. SP17BM10 TaxID=3002530 RepID=UPI002E760B8A|nr:VOC family protein [Streptomyces sp. SP17BM10]MEE1782568.1 VOC family protein [Streptomyces sp. SP17BM10]